MIDLLKKDLSIIGIKMFSSTPGMVVYVFNPNTWKTDAGRSLEFKARLVYRVNYRTARAAQRNRVSKSKMFSSI